MHLTTLAPALLTVASLASAQLGYGNITSSTNSTNITFGTNYAVLNLDLINALVSSVNATPSGDLWINSTATWINAVHAQKPQPLTFFSRIYFSTVGQPEIGPTTPFGAVAKGLGNVTAVNASTEIWPAFKVAKGDVVIQKARYYAGAGNQLEEILRAQKIDTVVLSGIRTSGVIITTALRLFDLDYKVFVIADNVIETAPNTAGIHAAILEGILPKLPATIISLKQALQALNSSGPASY
ncbi:hypothetical protein P7C70_g8602, partial [Phenoliferia sp. Uapishka_3]